MSRTEWVGPGDPPYTPESILRKDVHEAVLKYKLFQSSNLFARWMGPIHERWMGPSDERSYVVFWFGDHNPICLYNEKYHKWFANRDMRIDLSQRNLAFDVNTLPDVTYLSAQDLTQLARQGLMGFLENQVNEENHK